MTKSLFDLKEFVVPILLESAESYKPLVEKRKFEKAAALLAKQSYWLTWFEAMEKWGDNLEAIQFTYGRVVQRPIWVSGYMAKNKDLILFEATRKMAVSKLHGKYAPSEYELLSESFSVAYNAVNDRVTLNSKDTIFERILGPNLNGFRMSKNERSDLEKLLWESENEKTIKNKKRL